MFDCWEDVEGNPYYANEVREILAPTPVKAVYRAKILLDENHVPDANFRDCIRGKLGADVTELTAAQLNEVKAL